MKANDRLPLPINPDYVLGMVTDAFEGGMSSWAQVERYRWPEWYEDGTSFGRIKDEVQGDYVLLRVRDMEPTISGDGQPGPWVDLTYALMEEAIQWALVHHNRWLPYTVRNGIVDDIDYDAVGADIALQKAVLDEVIYG